jgi:hypothetical protein
MTSEKQPESGSGARPVEPPAPGTKAGEEPRRSGRAADEPRRGTRPAEDVATDDGGAQRLVHRFTRHYYEYRNALGQIQIDAARRQEELNVLSAETSRQDEKAAFKPAQDAYFEYLQVFQRAQVNPMETGVAEVYRAQNHYIEIYQRSQEAARRAAEQRRKEYAAECAVIQRETGDAQRSAFVDYVRAVKELWAEVDPRSFDARALGTASQSIVAVATCVLSEGQLA